VTDDTQQAPRGNPRRWLLALLPLAVAVVIGGFLYRGLYLQPRVIPSALIDKPVPAFDLPALDGRGQPGLASADLKTGEVSLVNVFASWCVACRVEHPLLMQLSESGAVPIHALNYKDEPEAALRWLNKHGDPYTRVGVDRNGRVGIDFGVYGVPETFVVTGDGRIVCKQIGPIMPDDLKDKIMPAVAAARAGEPVKC
jgi:cytochrome c biogenesis protein CcmG/thiol:disulfide interchange protein DsbE